MAKDGIILDADAKVLEDKQLEGIAGGGKGGKPGCCSGCGGNNFISLGGDKIRCKDCGWEGTRTEIGA